ncbi:phenoloxidase-activating factor 2 isoform X2 [Drosophila subpulchrella]|uniref:phenoloxidase-activating factor 2 isoform X2 n=1 Tax=Drosophila subpulchrella TaxID=1486046 RepID=UPI0018A16CBB|nr:phenoloxidase-activating factor 2 isoform X2 [Drosophila subpulchrella]
MVRPSILCLLLGLYTVEALFCGTSNLKECVPHYLCRNGNGNGKPVKTFRSLAEGNNGCPAAQTCCPRTEILQYAAPVPVPGPSGLPACGHANRDGLTFTIANSGDTAQEAELPWMVILLTARSLETVGGGSLIKPDVVLSNTEKTIDYIESQLIVRAGEWDLSSNAEHGKHEDVAIRKIVRHPDFHNETGAYNVALLFLERPLQLTSHINLICLPPPNRAFIFNRCIVSGWGKRNIHDMSYMNLLKKIEVPLVQSYTCEQQLRMYDPTFNLHDSLICAGGEIGKDSCEGDGGAPLACPVQGYPNRYEQVGIVNFGYGCGGAIPAAYTDVSKMRPWIDHQIQENSVGSGGHGSGGKLVTTIKYPSQGNNVIQSPVRFQGHDQGALVNNANDPNGYQGPVQGQGRDKINFISNKYGPNGYQGPGQGQGYGQGIQEPFQGQGQGQNAFVNNGFHHNGYQRQGQGHTTIGPLYDMQPVQGGRGEGEISGNNIYGLNQYQRQGTSTSYGYQGTLQGAPGTNGNMNQNIYQTSNVGGSRYDGAQGIIPAGGGAGFSGAGHNYNIGGGDPERFGGGHKLNNDEIIENPKKDNTITFENIPTTTTPIAAVDMQIVDA